MKKKTNSMFENDLDNSENSGSTAGSNSSDMDFAKMFSESNMGVGSFKVGQLIRAEILSFARDEAFLSIGGPVDGILPVNDLKKDGVLAYKVGDIIQVKIVGMKESEIRLRKEGATSSNGESAELEDAFDMELPVEGKVLEAVKGGFRVSVGGVKAFCPLSQIDNRPVTDAQVFVGKKYEFMVTEYAENGRKVVVSRRKLQDQKKAEEEGEFLERHKLGDLFEGEITRIEKYGAFIKLPNELEGLIPISEMAWGRVENPSDLVHIGQKVSVALLKMDDVDGRLKLSFSIKQGGGESDPWLKVQADYPVGRVLEGTVTKKETYGLFVQLSAGVTGLLPRSQWKEHVEGNQYENKKKGDKIQVKINTVSFEEKRISLGIPGDSDGTDWQEFASKKADGKGLGTFADLLTKAASQNASKSVRKS